MRLLQMGLLQASAFAIAERDGETWTRVLGAVVLAALIAFNVMIFRAIRYAAAYSGIHYEASAVIVHHEHVPPDIDPEAEKRTIAERCRACFGAGPKMVKTPTGKHLRPTTRDSITDTGHATRRETLVH